MLSPPSAAFGMLRAANNGGERRENDFYPTPPEPTVALIPHLSHWPRRVWEPACGDGGIAKPLERAGFDVIGTDLVDRGYGTGGLDFLQESTRRADALVTNPPFGKLVTAFINHALNLEVPRIAMLLNVNLWHAAGRSKMWNRRVPEAVLALTWRPDWTQSGAPYFNMIWTVWGPESAKVTRYERLSLPRIPACPVPA
jgi:hypothetical protein